MQIYECKITYLGHIIDKNGLHKDPEKIRAIADCPQPKNVSEVKAYIGMINYYARFIRNISTLLESLYALLRDKVEFKWSEKCKTAFVKSKEIILSEQTLAHFNPKLPLKVVCDASKVGIGSVLLQIYEDGSERPVSFVSRTLNNSELNYSVIHKEALAIYWGVKNSTNI